MGLIDLYTRNLVEHQSTSRATLVMTPPTTSEVGTSQNRIKYDGEMNGDGVPESHLHCPGGFASLSACLLSL